MGDAIVLSVLVLVLYFAARSLIKNHKSGGGCSSCSGGCSKCAAGCGGNDQSSSKNDIE